MPPAETPLRETPRGRFHKEAGAEPIPGYRLVEPLGRGGFGEVWKCLAPGGLFKAIKFVHGVEDDVFSLLGAPAEEEWQAVQRVKEIRHPFLLSMERVECTANELIIVTELADKSLHDLLTEYQAQGMPGIPREELLSYLREAAEALDLLNFRFGLQHLDVKPRNLFLVSNHVKVADFGLVNSMRGGGGLRPGAVTPLYASPETFGGNVSQHSDQYSLAVVYQELLTGRLPFRGKNARQLLLQHAGVDPDLTPLPPADLPVVARALTKDPAGRFPSCTEFVAHLTAATGEVAAHAGPAEAGPEGASETRRVPRTMATIDLATPAVKLHRPREGEGLAGWKFLDCLQRSPLGEVWRVEATDGRTRQAKVLFGVTPRAGGREAETAARLKLLRHPNLLAVEAVLAEPGRLVLVTPPAGKSLKDRLQETLAAGESGVPRRELLGYLRAAAEALDFLAQRHDLFHLGLNPRTLLLDEGRLLLADFGVAQLLWLPAGQDAARLNARYSAPELFDQQPSAACDQYSLALVYAELLANTLPPRNATADGPGLAALPVADRPVLARALHADPHQRWPSCTEMVQALEAAGTEPGTGPTVSDTPNALGILSQLMQDLASPGVTPPEAALTSAPSDGSQLQARFSVRLTAGQVRARLEALRIQWNGQLARAGEDTYAYRVTVPGNFWRRCIGRQPGLKVHVKLAAPRQGSTDVSVQVRPHGCPPDEGTRLLQEMGVLLLESARVLLQASPARRANERLAWHYPVRVRSLAADGAAGDAVECQGKDISATGIGFYLAQTLPTTRVQIELPPTAQTPPLTMAAGIVRVQRCGDGWFEVGAVFLPPSLRPTQPHDASVTA